MKRPTLFVSPISRLPLIREGDTIVTPDGRECYPVEQGELVRLDLLATGDALLREREIFDSLPIQGVSYFHSSAYQLMLASMLGYLAMPKESLQSRFRFAELGGGEGHCAQHVKKHIKTAEVFICDISSAALARASHLVQRVCADITRPIFEAGTLHAVAFWVSLHHIPEIQRRQALTEAHTALAEGGILILFEPNRDFALRRVLYRSRLRRDVYFDEEETALDFAETTVLAQDVGFTELETVYLNPAYNSDFVRQLRRWWLFLPVVNALFIIGQMIYRFQKKHHSSRMKLVTLYGMSIFRKTSPAK